MAHENDLNRTVLRVVAAMKVHVVHSLVQPVDDMVDLIIEVVRSLPAFTLRDIESSEVRSVDVDVVVERRSHSKLVPEMVQEDAVILDQTRVAGDEENEEASAELTGSVWGAVVDFVCQRQRAICRGHADLAVK